MKQYYTSGIGSNQELKEDANNIVDIYESKDDIDIDTLEEGQIVATTGDTINNSEIETIILNNAKDKVERLIANSGVPAGTIANLNTKAEVVGWLKCDGSTFDKLKYPFLYSALLSDKLPLEIVPDEWEVNKELFTGEFFFGKPVYSFSFIDTTTRVDSWTVLTPGGDAYFPYTHNIERVINITESSSHNNSSYQNGIVNTYIYQINNTVLNSETNKYEPTATSQLMTWHYNQSYRNATIPAYTTVYYIKLEDDYTNAKYKYIRAISGTEEENEADQVTNAINQYKSALVDTSGVPAGTIIEGNYSTPPEGYLPCNGEEFDTTEYPILYSKLNSNKLPLEVIRNDNIVVNEEVMTGKFYKGRMVYRYAFPWVNATSSSWVRLTGTSVIINQYHIDEIIYGMWASHQDSSTNYSNGDAAVGMHIGTDGDLYLNSRFSSRASDNDHNIVVMEYVKKEGYEDYTNAKFKYIKATSGINNTESADLVNAINELKQRVAYSSLPVGNVIQMKDNEITPEGYLLADGRDTTGTSEELSTKYPLLYTYLNSNTLPEIGDELDWANAEYLTYNGTLATTGDPGSTENNVSYTMERAGMFIANTTGFNGSSGWITVNGHVIDKMGSHSSTWMNNTTTCIPVKKGDVVAVYLAYTSGGWYNYQTFIPYKTFKYIKAVSGVEEGDESTTVANAISTATTSLQNNYEEFKQEIRNAEFRTRYTLFDAGTTPLNTDVALSDSAYNYDYIELWFRRNSNYNDGNYVQVVPHTLSHDLITSLESRDRFFLPSYYDQYYEGQFLDDGNTLHRYAGGAMYVWKVVGIGKRS